MKLKQQQQHLALFTTFQSGLLWGKYNQGGMMEWDLTKRRSKQQYTIKEALRSSKGESESKLLVLENLIQVQIKKSMIWLMGFRSHYK